MEVGVKMINQKRKEQQNQEPDIYDIIVTITEICALIFGILILIYLIITGKII